MARIAEYFAPEGDTTLRPSETGAEAHFRTGRIIQSEARLAGSELGNAISTVGDQVAKVVYDHASQSQKVASAAGGIETLDGLQQAWTEAQKNIDPHNMPEARQAWLDNYAKPLLDKYTQGAGWTEDDQKFRQGQVDRFLEHLTLTTGADMASAANHAMAVDLGRMKDSGAAAVFNNPHSLDLMLGEAEQGVGHITGGAKGASADAVNAAKTTVLKQINGSYVQAAVRGMLAKGDTAGAEAMLHNPKYASEVDPGAMFSEINQIKTTQKSLAAQSRIAANQERQMALEGNVDRFLAMGAVKNADGRVVGFNPTPQMGDTLTRLLAAGALPPAQAESLTRWYTAETERMAAGRTSPTTDPNLLGNFQQRSLLGSGSPGSLTPVELNQALYDHRITLQEHDRFDTTIKEVDADPVKKADGAALKEYMDSVRQIYTKAPIAALTMPENSAAWANFQSRVTDYVRTWRAQNPGANINSLFDTHNPQNPLAVMPADQMQNEARAQLNARAAVAVPAQAGNKVQLPGGTTLRGQRAGESDAHYQAFLRTGQE